MAGAIALVLVGVPSGNASGLIIRIAAVQEDVDSATPGIVQEFPREDAEFADAPYGVDPMVTGPVSTAFRQQQEAANCDQAVWPNVPAVCFPD